MLLSLRKSGNVNIKCHMQNIENKCKNKTIDKTLIVILCHICHAPVEMLQKIVKMNS